MNAETRPGRSLPPHRSELFPQKQIPIRYVKPTVRGRAVGIQTVRSGPLWWSARYFVAPLRFTTPWNES